MSENKYRWIDNRYQVDFDTLPKWLQNYCREMEEFDREGNWMMYTIKADDLEDLCKDAVSEGTLSLKTWRTLINRYPIV